MLKKFSDFLHEEYKGIKSRLSKMKEGLKRMAKELKMFFNFLRERIKNGHRLRKAKKEQKKELKLKSPKKLKGSREKGAGLSSWLAMFFIPLILFILGLIMGAKANIGAVGGVIIGLGFVGAYVLQGFRKIPADPPHKAVVTKWGKRQTIKKIIMENGERKEIRVSQTKDEGWRFFPLYPYWYGYIKVNVAKKNPDFEAQTVMTPDMGSIKIPPSITYTPDPLYLIEYINSGKEEGVDDILGDIVRQRLREWAIAAEEGPQTWEEAMKARDEAILLLAKAILGEELPQICRTPNIPSQVPTTFWFKYFYSRYFDSSPKQWPDEDSEDFLKRQAEWYQWKDIIQKEIREETEENFIRKQVDNRKEEIKRIRQGNGDKKIRHLGIILNRLNLGEFEPQGELAKAAELRAKERREMVAEKFELEHVQKRVSEFKNLGFSAEQGLEVVQTERAKVQKQIQENKWSVSPETRGMIEKIAPEMLAKILGR